MNCAYANSIDREHAGMAAAMYKRIPTSLTDHDIIELNDTFLCNGTHFLKVNDIEHGRQLLELFLSSLGYYHAVGCLTLFSTPGSMPVGDIFQELAHGGYIDRTETMGDYFFDQFDYDFLWIELTAPLSSLNWYQAFTEQLHDSNVAERMPIVKLLYEV